MERNLSKFSADYKLSERIKLLIWNVIQNLVLSRFFAPSFIKVGMLRIFGAQVGNGTLIRRGVRVNKPWMLSIGENTWVGEGVWFINHDRITVGSNVCISQQAIICSSSHDFQTPSLDYKHSPVKIEDGVWICLAARVLPGAIVGKNCVIGAGEIFSGNLPRDHIFIHSAPHLILDKI